MHQTKENALFGHSCSNAPTRPHLARQGILFQKTVDVALSTMQRQRKQPPQPKKAKPSRLKESKEIGKEASGKSTSGRRRLAQRIPVNLASFRAAELLAIALYHCSNTFLGPLCIDRILPWRPHALAISAVSLWWTFAMTGTMPHLAVRITESRLRRPNVPHPVLSMILHVVCRSVVIYYSTRNGPDLAISWKLLTNDMPLDLLRTTAFTVAILVLPTMLKVNRIQFPNWILLLLLAIPSNDSETNLLPAYQPITYYLVTHLLAGVVAGRWMQWSFPDDPTPRMVVAAAP
jgi:hypothetical protein